jgi:hypothetical protein
MMHRRTWSLVSAAFAALALVLVAPAPGSAQVTTTPEVTTTTTAAPTTTTVATTTTTNPPTTTSVAATTTPATVVPVQKTDNGSSSTPWVLIIVVLAILAVGLIATLGVRRRAANSAKRDWNAAAASARRDAELTRDMLSGEARPGEVEDRARQRAVDDNVARVSARFEQLAANAPDDASQRNATAVATALRGYLFALEAERLLRNAPTPPSAEQLTAADATRRSRANDLEAALAALPVTTPPPVAS